MRENLQAGLKLGNITLLNKDPITKKWLIKCNICGVTFERKTPQEHKAGCLKCRKNFKTEKTKDKKLPLHLAIVADACKSYFLLKTGRDSPGFYKYEKLSRDYKIHELLNFFNSKWFEVLTLGKVDPEYILNNLNKQVEEYNNEKLKKRNSSRITGS